jgi:tRNA A-37 threonylcarbamoyl transferase component Bud32
MPDPTPTLAHADPPLADAETLAPDESAGGAAAGVPAVPGFAIEAELGRGGMGVVYRARQAKLNRTVALKMVLAGGHASPQERTRFLAEAEAVAAVQHQGIVQVYELGTCGDQPYFALEFCPGGSLAGKLAGTPLPARDAAAMVERIARAVQAAHEKGIVHRDLKPDNVLFAADGTPKVTDFGLARRVEGDSGLTRTGAIMGTPSYMAPEQAAGKKEIGPAADVWALGAILYECLTGRPPFRAATALDTVVQVVSDEPVPPRKLVPGLPRDVETVCLKCLQKEPGKRYGSAVALANDLNQFLDGKPITARPVPAWERAWKAAKRRPAVAAALAAAILAVVSVVAVVLAKNAELKQERDTANDLRYEAEVRNETIRTLNRNVEKALESSEEERKKAHARLGKAVEAVEKTLARAGTARWAREPALAAERRQVLEDAVAFYESFKDADAADPLVRRQAATAYRRVGGLYLLLAENGKAITALARARAIDERLVAEYPSDPGYSADLAESLMYVGHAANGDGRMDDAKAAYRAAAVAGRAALAGRPGDDDIRRTLVACLIGHAFSTMRSDRAAAAGLVREAIGHADELTTRPDARFASRALAAYAYAGATLIDLMTENPADGRTHGTRAADLLAASTPDPDAPALFRDLYDMAGGMLKLTAAAAAGEQPQKAATLLREAAEVFDRLLAVYPSAFQYRLYKLMILANEVEVLSRLNRGGEARRRRDELFATEDAVLKTSPNLFFVKFLTAEHRLTALRERADAGDVGRLDTDAADLLAMAASHPNGGGIRYNVACVYAQASKHGTPAGKEACAVKAVRMLTELLNGNFYKGPTNAAHVDKDTDLDPIRNRDDFKAFRAKMPAAGK